MTTLDIRKKISTRINAMPDSKRMLLSVLGYVDGLSKNPFQVADEDGTSIDVVLTKSDVPFHAEIRFTIDGQLIKGNNQNPHFLRYKDKLKNLFAKDIFKM